MIQSVLFDKHYYDLKDALIWMRKHRFHFIKIHETKNYIRFGLIPPDLLRLKRFTQFRTKKFGDYIKVILAF